MMKSYRRPGYRNFRTATATVIMFGVVIFSAALALAAPQYNLKCDDCHTMPPQDSGTGVREPLTGAFKGSHQGHADSNPVSCSRCHGAAVVSYPTGHRDRQIEVNGNINNSPAGATYSRSFFNQTSVPPNPLGTCSNVNCHFESATPEWGSSPLGGAAVSTCSTCHPALPSSNAHQKHLDHYGNSLSVCAKCHSDHAAEADPFLHATSVGNAGRGIHVTAGSYTGSNYSFLPSQSATRTVGTCTNVYCHSRGQNATGGTIGAGDYASPKWDVPATGACGSCHGTTSLNSGSHAKHIALPADCSSCHVNASAIAYTAPSHVDGNVDVDLGGYDKAGAPGNGYGSCSTAVCHASPYASTSTQSPVWGTSAGCSACHNGIGAFGADGAPQTGSHQAHMAQTGSACGQCHTGAVKLTSGGANHANGTVEVDNGYTASPVTKHAPGTYTGTCLSASCHVSPYGTTTTQSPVWGSAAGCAACHNGAGAFTATGAPATGSHDKHLALNNAACNQCHNGAISGVSGGATHTNGTVEVANGYTASPVTKHPIGTYSGSCSNASCHNDGNGNAVSSPVWGIAQTSSCASCHGGDSTVTAPRAPMATGKHRSHMNNYSTLGRSNNLMCAECHAKTVSMASNTVVTGKANHINGFKDFSGARAGKNYDTGSGTCANVYCHSSGEANPRFRNMTGSKAWGGTAKFDCSGCHGNEQGASWVSGFGAPNYANKYDGTLKTANSHELHVKNAGITDTTGCAKCHRSTVDAAAINKLRDYSTAHLNSVRDVAFLVYGNYSANTKSCTTYCHSNVQAAGGNAPATSYAKPQWGANGTVGCGSCHKNMSTLTETPDDLALGSHKRHTVDAGYSCGQCHGNGYSPTTVGATHVNDNIDVVFSGKGANTTYSQAGTNVPGDGYGTCSTSSCHGRATRNWGSNTAAPTCEKCHGSANTAQTTGLFQDTAGNAGSAYAGSHASHLAGKHNISNPITCDQCHTVPASVNSFGHMSSLPARLSFGTLASQNGTGGVVLTPSYSGGIGKTCSNTYCHSGVRNTGGNPEGTNPAPSWNDTAYLGGSGCDKCHGYPPQYPHASVTNCSGCHTHVAASNIAFVDKSKHINGVVDVTIDDCLGCHSSYNACQSGDPKCVDQKLLGAHLAHTDPDIFLVGKKLSNGDFIDPSWIYDIKYKNGFPQFACGFCHPMDQGTHRNGSVNLDLDPTHSRVGTVKANNKAGGPWLVSYNTGSSVVCSNVYCHSNGYVSPTTQTYQYNQTPDWYASNPWGAVDRCNQCHNNSPNANGTEGSPAHARHVVANHYKDVFSGYSGLLNPAGAPGTGSVHGDPATSTTFNCNICHNATVRDSFNDKNPVCANCHNGTTAPLKGVMRLYSSNTTHINGDVDVVFMDPFNVKSKAQIRDDIAKVQGVYTSWTRVKGYKTYSSFDLARVKPSYFGGTCSTVACHNGTQMEWKTQGPLDCSACHTGLPQ